ncbi:MAG: 30S ribosomal protein S2 [Solobacterium sp.]|nr:30S ribosomal protein S2 [Solobacterium sp.]MCH4221808.1 30S ribosomal protein S2 [Solobacterium sp.]MCH4265030.1 30S ribosomal protein S2 [Solobacterium sp.]
MTVVSMRKMLENGVHFGHQTRKWNPKFRPYIYTSKNGVYIIDLEKTEAQLDIAYAALKDLTEKGGKILFVGTKKQAQATVLEEALRSGSFYVNQRWLGGTLTNFRTIQKSIKKLVDIEEMETSGTINAYTKKEQAQLLKKKERLENFLGGIKEMKKLPDAVFVVDPLEEHNAVAEARKLHIPVFALIDTNADPNAVDFPIPSNDDAIRSIKLMVGVVADAIVEAKGGVLEFAHQEDATAEDITMKDVMVNVEQQAAEYEKKRRQRMEERRAQMAQRGGYNNRGNGERRVFHRNSDNNYRGNRTGGTGTGSYSRPAAAPTAAPAAAPAAAVAPAAEAKKEAE